MDKNKCPKCGGEMEEGKLNARGLVCFVSAEAKGIPLFNKNKVKFNVTYRCKNCGFLESYAK